MKSWAWAALPLLAIAAILLFLPPVFPDERGWLYLAVMALLASELVIIGWIINGRPAGTFVDNRNCLSLSKLQAAAWTVVVLAAFSTAAAYNATAQGTDYGNVAALAVVIPGELLLAMGISATSLVAAPALLSIKSHEEPTQQAKDAAEAQGAVPNNGKVFVNASVHDASWGDIFTGDELGNALSPDLGKIQQVLITLVLLGCYAFYVFALFQQTGTKVISALPTLDKSFVWLLGISHASYLAYKAAPHTQTDNSGN